MIVPDAILEIAAKADPDALEDQARELQSSGGSIRSSGVQIDRTWQGLSTVYRAPEATDLLAATAPIKTIAQTAETELNRVAIALVHYAQEVRAIKAKLKALHTEARTLVAKADAMGPEKFEDDTDLQQHNNSLINQVNAMAMAFQVAQEKCARSIYAAYGAKAPTAQKPTGKPQPLPWGTTENPDLPWYKDAWNGGKSLLTGFFKDGLGGDIQGLWNLATSPSKWWGTYKTIMALGAPIFFTPVMIVPSVRRKSFDSWQKFGKSFVAWNRWKDDPARATGQTLYNIITTVVPVGRAATPATLAADAGKTAKTLERLDKATRYVDPIGEGARATLKLAHNAPKVGDLLKHLNIKVPGTPPRDIELPDPHRTPTPEPSPRTPAADPSGRTPPETNNAKSPLETEPKPAREVTRPSNEPGGGRAESGQHPESQATPAERGGRNQPEDILETPRPRDSSSDGSSSEHDARGAESAKESSSTRAGDDTDRSTSGGDPHPRRWDDGSQWLRIGDENVPRVPDFSPEQLTRLRDLERTVNEFASRFGVRVDYTTRPIDPANAVEMNRAINRIAAEYPSIFREVGQIRIHTLEETARASLTPTRELGVTFFTGDRLMVDLPGINLKAYPNGIYLNQHFFGNRAVTDYTSMAAHRSGWNVEGSGSIEGTLYHEFGHRMGREILNNPQLERRLSEELSRVGLILDTGTLNIDLMRGRGAVKEGLSEYGSKNTSEMLAEGFAEWKLSNSPRPIARVIGEFMDRHFKGER